MRTTRAISAPGRRALAVLLLVGSTLLAGCSQEFTGIDDVYVPTRPEERFPIEVVEKPVKLTVSAASGKLGPAESDQIIGLAWQAKTQAITGVTVAYPAGSRHGRKVAAEVAALVAQQGVPRARIHTAAYNGKSDSVTMAFVVRVASTKECGDWSHNLANTYKNELFPNMGCAMQNNVAAMVCGLQDAGHEHLSIRGMVTDDRPGHGWIHFLPGALRRRHQPSSADGFGTGNDDIGSSGKGRFARRAA